MNAGGQNQSFVFGPFRFVRGGGVLYRTTPERDWVLVSVGSRALDVLAVLLGRPGELVSKSDIMTRVWPDTVVEEGNLTVQISALRKALNAGGAGNGWIVTVPGRGYRFAGQVLKETDAPKPAMPPPDKPSIAVLAFINASGDPAKEYFSDGFAEDLTIALSRNRRFFVIAQQSSFSYKGSDTSIRVLARELGVRYVVKGSVRLAAGRLRIAVQLVE
jgi:TolB-like protein